MKPRPDLRYSLLTAAVLAAIFVLSSQSGLGPRDPAMVRLLWNLAHIPIYAGLTFLWFKVLAGGQATGARTYVGAFLAATACGVIDEWHQSFVPGRTASVGDLARDVVGIAAMLVVLRCTSGIGRRRQVYS